MSQVLILLFLKDPFLSVMFQESFCKFAEMHKNSKYCSIEENTLAYNYDSVPPSP